MIKKIKLAILLMCLSTIIFTSCNMSNNSEIELNKITEDDMEFGDTKSTNTLGISYGQSGYILKGDEAEDRNCYVSLNTFHDGIVENVANSEVFPIEFDKIYFSITGGNVYVCTVNNNVVKNVLNYELDSTLFTKENLNVWYWKDKVKLVEEGSGTIFASFLQKGSEVSSPDLDEEDVDEYAKTDKDRKGIFLKFHLNN